MTKYQPFRQGEMLEVRNDAGALIAWGSFDAEDKDYTFLRQVVPAPHKPYWAFEIGRFPSKVFAFSRMAGKRGDVPLFERAMREEIEMLGNHRRAGSAIFMMRAADPQVNFEHRRFGTGFRFEAIVQLEFARLKTKGALKSLHFPSDYENRIYSEVHSDAVTRMVMDKNIDQELLIARVIKGRWTNQSREHFLVVLERIGSPHLNLFREVLGAKNLKNEGVERFPKGPRYIDW